MPATVEPLDLVPLDAHQQLLEDYRISKAASTYWAERAEALKNEVIALMGDADTGTVGGAMVLRRIHYRGATRLDTGAVRQRYPDIYAACQVTGTPYDQLRFLGA